MRNHNYLILALLGVLLAWPIAAQEADEPSAAEVVDEPDDIDDTTGRSEGPELTEAAENAADAEVEEDKDETIELIEIAVDLDNPDDIDLDDQSYEEDDDVFVPTQEIPVGELIAFPSNI